MSPRWHKLSLQTKTLPPLLFRYTWTHEGYELYLTDLTSVWSEQLFYGNIVQRAEQECTTIDPSEGKDQMKLLLTKVGEALDGAGGEPRLNSGSQTDSIEINITAKLPAPLKPLKWKMHLSKEPTSSVTNHLLLPLLNDEATWKSRQQVLLSQIKQKDWILEKLFDRMDALGVDISTVFPSAAGIRSSRKGDTRSEVGKIIKGVAPFDEQAWLAELDNSPENFNLASNIVHEIFGVNPENFISSFKPRRDDWWTELKGPSKAAPQEEANLPSKEQDSINSSSERQANRPDADLSVQEEATADTTDSEFEQQKGPREKASTTNAKNSSNFDPEAPLQIKEASLSQEPEPTAKPPKKPMGRLGMIGGKRKQSEKTQPSPSPAEVEASVPTSPIKSGDPVHETTPATPPPAKAKKPTKLGLIGGKGKVKRKEAPPPKSPPRSPTASPIKSPEYKQTSPEKMIQDPPEKARSPVQPPARKSPQIPETEQEKAARRREELKRQLEAQSRAPAKKKRKF